MSDKETFEIDCDDLTQRELRGLLQSLSVDESNVRGIRRSNLDGETATWIVLATLTSQVLPHLLNFLVSWRNARAVTRIKVGDIEIENPTPQDLELLRAKFSAPSLIRE